MPAPMTTPRADAPLSAAGGGAGQREALTALGHDGQAGDTSRAGTILPDPAREVPIYPTDPHHPIWTELTQ